MYKNPLYNWGEGFSNQQTLLCEVCGKRPGAHYSLDVKTKSMYCTPGGRGGVDMPVLDLPGYPDGNPKSLQGAKKYSLRYLPLPANIAVNRAFEDGATKYGPANWREKGVAASVYIDAALRHINQWYDGHQDDASDSGIPNLGHAMACLAIILDAQHCGTLTDDRPFGCLDTDAALKREVKDA
jgi:hypothetical protein